MSSTMTIAIPMSVAAAIPLVSGRHRNRALAVSRHARAVQLATEGATHQEIVDERTLKAGVSPGVAQVQ